MFCEQMAGGVRVQEFLEQEGIKREDGSREDPPLPAFEAEVARYRAFQVSMLGWC